MRGEIPKAASGKLDDFGLRHGFEVGRRTDDVVGDQMRQMAGDREDEIMMLGRHYFDIGARCRPEVGEAFHRLRVGAFGRRQDAPAG